MNIKKKLIKETFVYSLQPLFERVVGFALIPIYIHYLTPADYGIWQFVVTVGTFLIPLLSGGLDTSFWKFRSNVEENKKGEVSLNVFLSQFLLGCIGLAVFSVVKTIFFNHRFGDLLIIYLAGVILHILYNNVSTVLRVNHKPFIYLTTAFSYSALLALSNIFFIAFQRLSFEGLVYSHVLVNIAAILIFSFVLVKEFKGRFSIVLSADLCRYGFPLIIGNVSSVILQLSDRFFLKAYATNAELGIYAFGCQFGNLVLVFIVMPFFQGWNPIRWEVYKMHNAKEIFSEIYKTLVLLLPPSGLFFAGMTVSIGAWLAKESAYLEGFCITVPIAFSHILYGLYFFNCMGMLFTEKTKLISMIVMGSAMINISLNFILIPSIGMVGAGTATFFSYLIMYIAARFFCQKNYPFKIDLANEFLQITLMVVFSSLSLVGFLKSSLNAFDMAILIMATGIIWMSINIGLNHQDFRFVANFLQKLKHDKSDKSKSAI